MSAPSIIVVVEAEAGTRATLCGILKDASIGVTADIYRHVATAELHEEHIVGQELYSWHSDEISNPNLSCI